MASGEKSIIIIGAGFAGLAVGIYGRLNGYKTRIFEMHSSRAGFVPHGNGKVTPLTYAFTGWLAHIMQAALTTNGRRPAYRRGGNSFTLMNIAGPRETTAVGSEHIDLQSGIKKIKNISIVFEQGYMSFCLKIKLNT